LVEEFADAVIVTRELLVAELDYAIQVAHQRGQPATAISAIMAKAKLFGLFGNKRADTNNDLNPYSQISSDELIYQITSTANEIRSALSGVPGPGREHNSHSRLCGDTAGVQLGVKGTPWALDHRPENGSHHLRR